MLKNDNENIYEIKTNFFFFILFSKMNSLNFIFLLILTIFSNTCFSRHKHFHSRVPIIDLNGAEELIGTIREDEQIDQYVVMN
ncbi:hypothetical protein Mgra_00000160 [Meloidogyne graminicola]|uniref:Uncharacterized protein n=1 Tax=Meloidogyne graminicola TaxID=189291 RepID=A0A8T0A4V9_9BILA|nr:hypothetical protein Mgra_00000160 [Meloidogyne graminicola]